MVSKEDHSRQFIHIFLFFLLISHASYGQVRKEFIDYLQEYSLTGYHIITEYEKKVNKPGYHEQFIEDKNMPLPVVAVHEVCHMWNWEIGGGISGSGKQFGYCLGYNESFVAKIAFNYFKSSEIKATIPSDLHTTITGIYIDGTSGEVGSIFFGLYGILDEYAAYINGLKSLVEMYQCFKKEFNTKENWPKYCMSGTSSIEALPEFRYFILKYILYAKYKYKTEYDKIIADQDIKQLYTRLTRYNERTAAEYLAIFDSVNITLESMGASPLSEEYYGIGWYNKFKTELAKQVYQDLDTILLTDVTSIELTLPKKKSVYKGFDFMVSFAPSGLLVNYRTPKAGQVTLNMYSVDGRLLKTLSGKEVQAGNHCLRIDYEKEGLKDYGIYIIRLEAGRFQKAKTVVAGLNQ